VLFDVLWALSHACCLIDVPVQTEKKQK
jgi:hypothetical protein